MSDEMRLKILNQAFVRVYRSFGQYLTDAWPVYDIGDESIVTEIIRREKADVDRMGEYLARRCGTVETGLPRIEFGDLHFLNFSTILPRWIAEQEALVAGLESDRRALEPEEDRVSGIIDQVLKHAKDHLRQLQSMQAVKAAA